MTNNDLQRSEAMAECPVVKIFEESLKLETYLF